MRLLIELVVAFASTIGFGIITNIPKRTLLPAGITGALAWVVYVVVAGQTTNLILPNLLAATTIGLLANIAAIWVKAPVNVMYIPSLVSLVPGAIIYMSMKDFTLGRETAAQAGLVKTLSIAIGLAVGFVIAEAIFKPIRRPLRHWFEARR
ncbi:threonine/serine exporter family protein [Lacticaseibacillus suibinensis]|uniref:threonine/serine exporter family protein n=1 Tax=Lacticaseibacillus suibinensis TaxID=2486011 RepID=UPI0019447A3D|nr:threonine/serine exporter family protein [Lacticaseibacillus suibinensis]